MRKALQECQYIKYLGVLIDSTLSWKFQTDKVANTLSRLSGIFYKVRPFVSKDILIMLYYSLIFSHLIYGIEAWGSTSFCNLNKILILQKKIVRIVT